MLKDADRLTVSELRDWIRELVRFELGLEEQSKKIWIIVEALKDRARYLESKEKGE